MRRYPAAAFFPPAAANLSRKPCSPACSAAEITINLATLRPDVRAEWDELKQHDVLFLLTIRPPDSITANYMAQSGQGVGKEGGVGVMERSGLQYVRGCEVIELRDEGEY